MQSPLEQFKINKILDIKLLGFDISFTNSSLWMLIAVMILVILSLVVRRQMYSYVNTKGLKPNRFIASIELLHNTTNGMVRSTIGNNGKALAPFIFTVFIFILLSNLLGMIPGAFTTTSHIAVTFALASALFIGITLFGIYKHGWRFLSLFLPKGTPVFLLPLMFLIELFAYLARPVSLSLRLAANMTAGHIVLKVIASFIIMTGIYGIAPFLLLMLLTGFEFFIAILQAYIFTILTCVYFNDAINLH